MLGRLTIILTHDEVGNHPQIRGAAIRASVTFRSRVTGLGFRRGDLTTVIWTTVGVTIVGWYVLHGSGLAIIGNTRDVLCVTIIPKMASNREVKVPSVATMTPKYPECSP